MLAQGSSANVWPWVLGGLLLVREQIAADRASSAVPDSSVSRKS